MLSNTLVTNEVKDAAGAEIEFERISMNGQQTIFRKVNETVGLPHRLTVSHSHVGSGKSAIRRSVVRFDITSENTAGDKVLSSAYLVLSVPEGVADDMNDCKKALANILSFCASLGASTTILYDGTGNGAASLLNETL
jgi:hypothetical protein